MFLKKIFFALTRLEKTVFVGAVIVFTAALSIKVSFYVQANTDVVPSAGGEYREGIVGQPVFINPVIPTTNADRDIARLVFGSLISVADSIKHSEDGTTWHVRLKQNLKWHNGDPVTSDDVMFTVKTAQDKESRSPYFSAFQGVEAERISELEVKFTLQTSYAFFAEEHLSNLGIIPRNIFADVPVENLRLSLYGLKPVGFGPYKAVGYDKDDRGIITAFYLEANKDYVDGEPKITHLTIKFYKNEDELVQAYNSGRIDGFGLTSGERINLSGEANDVKIRHVVHNLKSSRYYAVFINQATGSKDIRNIKVREALSRVIDREAIIKEVFHSYGLPMHGPTPLSHEDENAFDPSILKGVKISVVVPDEDFLLKTMEIVQSHWQKAGAEVTLLELPIKTVQDKILRNTDYELLAFGNITGSSSDLFSFWHSSRRFYPDQNLSLYQNKKVDALLESYRKELDAEKRKEVLKSLSDIIALEYPAVFLYSPNYIYISTPSLNGFNDDALISLTSDRFRDVAEWYVRTKRVF